MKIKTEFDTPLYSLNNCFGVRNLYCKDESRCPTSTFKDRLSNQLINYLVDEYNSSEVPSTVTIASISYGNTAYSLVEFSQKLNNAVGREISNVIIFTPPFLGDITLGPDINGKSVSGKSLLKKLEQQAQVIEIDLNKQIYTSNDLEIIARECAVCNEKFIDVTEGLNITCYREIAVEIFEKQLENPPDYIIVPFGAGILCNEVIDYISDNNFSTKVIPVSSGNPNTIATMIYGPIWVDTKSLLKNGVAHSRHNPVDLTGRKRLPYPVYHVRDNEILSCYDVLKDFKIECEPSGASGFAILNRLGLIDPEFNPQKHSVVVINTGNGLLNF